MTRELLHDGPQHPRVEIPRLLAVRREDILKCSADKSKAALAFGHLGARFRRIPGNKALLAQVGTTQRR